MAWPQAKNATSADHEDRAAIAIVRSRRAQAPSLSFPLAVWTGHARALLHTWLHHDFTWDDIPLSAWINRVEVTLGDTGTHAIWTAPPDLARLIPAPGERGDWTLDDVWVPDLWHPHWPALLDAWSLNGRWLHPETMAQIDPQRFARGVASLLISCVDRDAPHTLRRYRPDLPPDSNDLGIIAFPLRTHDVMTHLHTGHTPATALLLCTGTAIVDTAIHEALETFQTSPGEPMLDPHAAPCDVLTHTRWHGQPPP